MSQIVEICAYLQVKDDQALLEYATQEAGTPVVAIEVALPIAVVSPGREPIDTGFTILSKEAKAMGGTLYAVRVKCRVFNEGAVMTEASECYRALWGDSVWKPAGQKEALFELLIASSSGPSFDVMGVEVIDSIDNGETYADWYDRRHELTPGMIFKTHHDGIVRLDRTVPGDATQWIVDDWDFGWRCEETRIEPGDLAILLQGNNDA